MKFNYSQKKEHRSAKIYEWRNAHDTEIIQYGKVAIAIPA
jgi:hypothetical protein